jgi:HD-GYP domain-containing protein (c-di-GMP phosphodiesterase class II)
MYDALTSNRPYRGDWSREKALEYSVEQSRKHFDPHIVETFLKLLAD